MDSRWKYLRGWEMEDTVDEMTNTVWSITFAIQILPSETLPVGSEFYGGERDEASTGVYSELLS